MTQPLKLAMLRRPSVERASGYSTTVLYDLIGDGLWTEPVKMSERTAAWPEHEVQALLAARIRGATDDEIRALVVKLREARRYFGADLELPASLVSPDRTDHADSIRGAA